MGHGCPECGAACYCCGDIDDILFEENGFCVHASSANCPGREEYDDGDFDEDSENDEPVTP
jgi:hypothetical protein